MVGNELRTPFMELQTAKGHLMIGGDMGDLQMVADLVTIAPRPATAGDGIGFRTRVGPAMRQYQVGNCRSWAAGIAHTGCLGSLPAQVPYG